MQLRLKARYLLPVVGLAGMVVVTCGGSAPPIAATSVPPTAVVVAVTAALPASTPALPAPEQVEVERAVVVFKTTDRSIEAPESIPAGLVTIRLQNDGSVLHSLTLIRADDGRTARELETKSKAQNWPTTWAPTVASITAQAGESDEFTAWLTPGVFAAVDWGAGADKIPYSAFGVYAGFEVSESESVSAELNPDAIEIGLDDFFFTGIRDLAAGRQDFKLVNRSSDQPHELTFVPLDEGQSAVELFEDFQSEKFGGNRVENLERAVGIGWIGPGQEVSYTVELVAGDYAVVCLLPDGFPGMPHVNLGMLSQINVSE